MSERYTPEQLRKMATELGRLQNGHMILKCDQLVSMVFQAAADAEALAVQAQEVARLTADVSELSAVCACGCPEDEHEDGGEDGMCCEQVCGSDCLRTSQSVRDMLQRYRQIIREQYQPRILAAETALAAERAKARALREWSRGHRTVRGSADYQQGIVDILELLESKLDALGLTGEAQP